MRKGPFNFLRKIALGWSHRSSDYFSKLTKTKYNMKKLIVFGFGLLLFANACQKETTPNADPKLAAIEARVAQALAEADAVLQEAKQTADDRANVVLPAGSNGGLAAAIAAAGPNGKVTVESGVHYESGTVEITFPVKIVGESGAVFEWSGIAGPSTATPTQLDPALHIKDANHVTIQGIMIDPGPDGAVNAILLDNAHNAKVLNNTLLKFQLAIVTGNADHCKIIGNTITGVGPSAPGRGWSIVNVDGNHNLITDNDVSDTPVAIFSGDNRGNVLRNTVHNSAIGVLLCTPNSLAYPNGDPLDAPESANDWLVAHNNAYNNTWGYLAIDNAFESTIFQNAASNNALYDIECAGDSNRFGFFTPTSREITVVSTGQYNNLSVQNCGVDCTIIGGQLANDPCF